MHLGAGQIVEKLHRAVAKGLNSDAEPLAVGDRYGKGEV